ncbi:MAG: Hpt domain-containing protein [Deltaproteobacteria bacterium]|nr:Hpt domain-containing protein [Deltaproteobacteria bacterium]
MDLEKYEKIFAGESEKYLDELDNALLEVEKDPLNRGLWSDIHGKIHSIKGMARALRMEKISGLCHLMEEWCTGFQRGEYAPGDEAVQLLFDGTRILRALAAQKEDLSDPRHAKQYHRLMSRFSRLPPEPEKGTPIKAPISTGHEPDNPHPSPDSIGHVRVEYSLIEELLGRSQEILHLKSRLPPMTRDQGSYGVKGWMDHYTSELKSLYFQLTKLRLIPVEDFAGLFRKALRDLARSYDREVSLEVIGGQLQVDIALMDRLREPFMHLLRNAVAHGIESPQEREAAGKPREGKVVLEAERRGDTLVLKVSDDGRGINRSAVTAYLKQKGSMSDEAISHMSEEEFLRTTLSPDFSATGGADEMAGRGVGMSVVAQAVENLNGSMSIRSPAFEGAQFVFRLPLLLSLVYAVTFRLGPYTLSIPTAHVQSIKGVTPADVGSMESLWDMWKRLGIEGEFKTASHVIELGYGGAAEGFDRAFHLAVEGIVGNRPLMVMPVDEILAKVPYIAGVGVMENGAVSILLETEELLESGYASGEK